MNRTRIKFCGITRPTDALAAAHAGADAIGLIFYPRSPRCVTVLQAEEILKSLPPMVWAVGLFVNASPQEVRQTAARLNLNTVQLHGNEEPDFLKQLPGLRVIKAIHCDRSTLELRVGQWAHSGVDALLLETANTAEPGGTGIENDWVHIGQYIKSGAAKRLPPLIAAGGLTPQNVGLVVESLQPWAVDVSTGIEESKGIKSMEKMQQFARAVRDADRTLAR